MRLHLVLRRTTHFDASLSSKTSTSGNTSVLCDRSHVATCHLSNKPPEREEVINITSTMRIRTFMYQQVCHPMMHDKTHRLSLSPCPSARGLWLSLGRREEDDNGKGGNRGESGYSLQQPDLEASTPQLSLTAPKGSQAPRVNYLVLSFILHAILAGGPLSAPIFSKSCCWREKKGIHEDGLPMRLRSSTNLICSFVGLDNQQMDVVCSIRRSVLIQKGFPECP